MRRKLTKSSATMVACTSIYLVVATAGASPSDSLWDSTWGNELPSGGHSNSMDVARDELPVEESPIDAGEEEDEPWSQKEDWWKDPLAMFDDDDEYVEDKKSRKEPQSTTGELQAIRQKQEERIAKMRAEAKAKLAAQERKLAEDKAKREKEAADKAARERLEKEKFAMEKAANDSNYN